MEINQKIGDLARQMIRDLREERSIRSKIEQLKQIAFFDPMCSNKIASWINSQNRKKVLKGLNNLSQFTQERTFSDRVIRLWRMSALIGALYYGRKFITGWKKGGTPPSRLSYG